MSKAPRVNSRPPHLLSSFILPSAAMLGKTHRAVALGHDTSICYKEKAGSVWLQLARFTSIFSGKDLSLGYFISDSLQSASSSLRAFNQRKDSISFGRQAITAFSHTALSQLLTALPSKQGSVRKFM